jgi:hypothetical protein
VLDARQLIWHGSPRGQDRTRKTQVYGDKSLVLVSTRALIHAREKPQPSKH